MPRKFETASDRLELLLPWLNGDDLPLTEIEERVREFVNSFDGSAAVGFVDVYRGEREPWIPDFLPDTEPRPLHRQRLSRDPEYSFETRKQQRQHQFWELREYLLDLLRRGFWPSSEPVGPWVAELSTLRIGVRGARHFSRPKLSRVSKAERRAYHAPGAYVLLVDGSLRDVVIFLVGHLLTAEGMTSIRRCPAPAPRTGKRQRCSRFHVATGRGRPRIFCPGAACRKRYFDEHEERIRPRFKSQSRRK